MATQRPICLVPVTYLRIALRDLDPGPNSVDAMLAALGISSGVLGASGHMASLNQIRSALRLLSGWYATPGWHLRLAAHLSITSHGPLGVAAATARDLGAAVDVLLRYSGVRAPFVWLSGAESSTGRFSLRVDEALALGGEREALVEIAMLCLQSIITAVLGFPPDEMQVELAYPEPVYVDALRDVFHGGLRCDSPAHRLHFPAALLNTECALYDEPLHRSALARCREILRETTGESDAEVAVRRALLESTGRLPGLDEIAADMGLSARTLIRRLERSGRAYREIRDEVLRGRATELLLRSQMSISQVGARLGYADPSNFSRAFRRWYGMSPGHYRRTA